MYDRVFTRITADAIVLERERYATAFGRLDIYVRKFLFESRQECRRYSLGRRRLFLRGNARAPIFFFHLS